MSWVEAFGAGFRGFVGHFENGSFVLGTPGGIVLVSPRHRASVIDFRVPISSNCTADPFSNDGLSCPLAAVNSPFVVFTTAGSPQRLFSQAILNRPNCLLFPGCSLAVVLQGGGAVIKVRLATPDHVGILVQRILRTKRVHGHRVFVLRTIGRVPLGTTTKADSRSTGTSKSTATNSPPGKYLITLRALGTHGNLLGHTKPVIITIH